MRSFTFLWTLCRLPLPFGYLPVEWGGQDLNLQIFTTRPSLSLVIPSDPGEGIA